MREFGLAYYGMDDARQGIVHVIGPEQGFTLPGTTVVCGDSHTSTHGAFGALAFGIGTSEVEHVLATQTLLQRKSKNMRINVTGKLPEHTKSKDLVRHRTGFYFSFMYFLHVYHVQPDVHTHCDRLLGLCTHMRFLVRVKVLMRNGLM